MHCPHVKRDDCGLFIRLVLCWALRSPIVVSVDIPASYLRDKFYEELSDSYGSDGSEVQLSAALFAAALLNPMLGFRV